MCYCFACALHVFHSLHIDLQVVETISQEGQDYDEVIEESFEEDLEDTASEDSANFVVNPEGNQAKP